MSESLSRRSVITGRLADEMIHISSADVSVLPQNRDDVVRALKAMDGVEVHHMAASKIVVVMGESSLRILNGLNVPLSRSIEQREGEIQAFTPTIDALYVPDIDASLDEEGAKQRFWRAFRMLGAWYEDLPPY